MKKICFSTSSFWISFINLPKLLKIGSKLIICVPKLIIFAQKLIEYGQELGYLLSFSRIWYFWVRNSNLLLYELLIKYYCLPLSVRILIDLTDLGLVESVSSGAPMHCPRIVQYCK